MAEQCQPPDPHPTRPTIAPPPGAVDTHAHIYGPFDRFPLWEGRGYTPHELGFDVYCDLLKTLGIERAVIVQGSANGLDHAVTLDAVARSNGRFKGVAIVRPETTETEVAAMAAAGGICGMRLSTQSAGGLGMEHFGRMTARAKGLGWLVQVHLRNIDEFPDLAPQLAGAGVDILIDHLGRPRSGQGVGCPAFRALLDSLRGNDRLWVKLCSWYRLSDGGPPYEDMRPFVDALIETRPDRLVWGTNWPHPNIAIPMPNDGLLLDQVMDWAGDEATRTAILRDNPVKLFGFE